MASQYERELERTRNSETGGSQSDHGKVAAKQPSIWETLTTEQREIQYERDRKCSHSYTFQEPPCGGQDLREPYSFDPYFRSGHMDICRLKLDPKCDCQMCLQKVGIARSGRFD